MANENYGQFLDGGVLQASDFLAGYRPPGVAGAEVRISGANILSYIQANITTPVQYNQPQIIGLTGGGATNLDGLSLTGFVVNSAIGITVAGAFHTWVLMSGNQATAIDAGTQTGIVQPVAQTAVYWQTLA